MTADPTPPPRGSSPSSPTGAVIVGRYALYSEFASGGMAAVHFGRLLGAAGFARTVAVKRLHPQFAKDPEFVSMFVDEARMAARIRHPNVVQTLDVVQVANEIFLVMDYVHGDSLANLLKRAQMRGQKVPLGVAVKIIQHALFGLQAAHEAKSERGEPLELVHRDMSPHNVLVGVDGVARVLDFGIAKAGGRVQVTRDGQVKGKLSYFAPEQLNSEHSIDRRADIYAASATLWEAITGRRLVQGDTDWQRVTQICAGEIVAPSSVEPSLPKEIDAIVMRGLAKDPADRFATARDMAHALDRVGPPASAREVGEWVEAIGGDSLRLRAEHVAHIESESVSIAPPMTAEEPTLTGPGVIVSESSANRNSKPAAMARSLSGSPSSGMRASSPSMTSAPTDSGARAMRAIRMQALEDEEEDVLPLKRRRWLLVPLLLVVLLFAFVVYMRFDPPLQHAVATQVAERFPSLAGIVHDPLPTVSSTPSNAPPVLPRSNAASVASLGSGALGSPPGAITLGSAAPGSADPNGDPSAKTAAGSAIQSAGSASVVASAGSASPAQTAWKPWKPWQPAGTGAAVANGTSANPSSASTGAPAANAPAKASASPAASECDVPYSIDSQGIRHPKPQCL